MGEPTFVFQVTVQPKPMTIGRYVDYDWVEESLKDSIEKYIYYLYGEPFDMDLKLIDIKRIQGSASEPTEEEHDV